MNSNHQTIIIVGGGISGLIGARELSAHYTVTIIEAEERLGGRIYPYKKGKFSTPIEAGAEFIHGTAKHTMSLLKEAGIKPIPVTGRMYRKEKSKWKEEEMIEGWDQLLKKMKQADTDMTLYELFEQYFKDDQYADLRRQATAFAEGFDLADIRKVSIKSLYREWIKSEESHRIAGGYGSLVDFLINDCKEKGCTLITSETVKQIDWEPGQVTVYTANEKKYAADKVVVTVPVSILQQTMGKAAINFTPPLDEYVKAAQHIGYGKVIKVVLEFKEIFWPPDAGFVFSDEQFPTWWTQLPDKIPLLTGWAGGSKAEMMSNDTEEALLEKALISLSNIFNLSVELIKSKLIASGVFNWQENPYTCGAYSFHMPQTPAFRTLLQTPVNDIVFFTGEALSDNDSPGTVEAAIEHAKETVKRIGR